MPISQKHSQSFPKLHHLALNTTFCGIEHPASTQDARIHQYLGIKYASIPARFRQSKLVTEYPPITDASQHGPICPQVKGSKTMEETLFGIAREEIPQQNLKQDEFECLNLNITCPAGLTPNSRIPVMLWVHGGGDRGSGSSWVYDGGAIVRKSIASGRPIILVNFNFRIGLFGFAASPIIRDDNKAAGEHGTGNYGLRDQRIAMEWLHHNITGFGGDPDNVTVFGAASGAADILCHMHSAANESSPMFKRAIAQSAIFEPTFPDVPSAGWHLSRIMSALQVSTIEELRSLETEKLIGLGGSIRTIDDGVFFTKGWQHLLFGRDDPNHLKPHHNVRSSRSRSARRALRSPSAHATAQAHHNTHGTLQPLIIGDCSCDSLLWSLPVSLWTSNAVVRRLKAVCQSLNKASSILRAYDISSYTPDDEIVDRVLELVNDSRVAWPTECIADNARHQRGGKGVWRYVFDQEGPSRGVPHHASDLVYLFDNVPLPASALAPPAEEIYCDGPFDVSDDSDDEVDLAARTEEEWVTTTVDEWSYSRVRDAMQERWIAFAYGEMPWHEEKVFVFGPEGETGERSKGIFEGRRRKNVWKQALEPLGPMLVQKVGVELSRGP
ncbi:Alpha/Beta hydrolase protein [Crucibulum laeve]|uniref:Alpha/Beta hydrolase protein n=1 Tax=Crucibulum laeve TaxID=68775 RepID=A0A5C3M8R5_9AGAR|nr:Alpha/Beta hydrolase protein [Crucibulum laeve]